MLRLLPLVLCACADNRAPVFDPPLRDTVVTVGRTVAMEVRAIDRDGDPVQYGARGLPTGSRFDRDVDPPVFRWAPLASDASATGRLFPVTFIAQDDAGATTEARVVLVVESGETRPRFTSPSAYVLDLSAGPTLEVVVTARDDDSATLSWELVESPAGAPITPHGKTAVLRWTPTADQIAARAVWGVRVGVYDDDRSGLVEQRITVVVDGAP